MRKAWQEKTQFYQGREGVGLPWLHVMWPQQEGVRREGGKAQ